MITPSNSSRILVATNPVDFRCGHKGLTTLIETTIKENPMSETLFVFRSKTANLIKILAWDGTGLVMIYKKLDKDEFLWPPVEDGKIELTQAQFDALFAGLDWQNVQAIKPSSLSSLGKRLLGRGQSPHLSN